MYKENPSFILPENNVKIWRYIDFTKFISMLDKESLFFTRSDMFVDKFEGTYPLANRKKLDYEMMERLACDQSYLDFHNMVSFTNYSKQFILVNCWHMNEYESAAMWDLYLKSNEGIAIQSNVEKLIDSFSYSEEEVLIGKVHYIDFKKECVDESDLYIPFTYKRKSFEHERELRALHHIPYINEEVVSGKHGMEISCDIRKLVENIYIAPNAPDWFKELVISMCEKFDLQVPVIKSELSEIPY
ncbi:hypothetical protein [Bacillus thuringiensis]|uniref:hypothetical protein n=1 Tax=Bacillus thuringiensis TaxID=1428 RepID=UPI0021D66DB2|nr:hypothetical protein [Bacillus thuringiensis]MCU7676262.1 hypothetical protein [Bacillus thuringiensis]